MLLSLIKLYARSIWHTLQGGQNGLSLWGHDEDKCMESFALRALALTDIRSVHRGEGKLEPGN